MMAPYGFVHADGTKQTDACPFCVPACWCGAPMLPADGPPYPPARLMRGPVEWFVGCTSGHSGYTWIGEEE